MDDFELELKKGFLEEASQLIGDTEQCFLSLESTPEDPKLLEKIFRLAHNLKGSAKAVGFADLGLFTHHFESFLLKVKNGQIPSSKAAIDLLLRSNDHLRKFVDSLSQDLNAVVDSTVLISELEHPSAEILMPSLAAESLSSPETSVPAESAPAPTETFSAEEIALANKTEDVISELPSSENLQAEFSEMLAAQPAIEPNLESPIIPIKQVAKTPDPSPAPAQATSSNNSGSNESIRVSLQRVEKLIDYVGELVILESVMKSNITTVQNDTFRRTLSQIDKVTKEIQDMTMGLRMVPLKQTFQKMQRIVRDTSGLLNKKVRIVLDGEDTEVDKTVLESLGDPLVHLIRNACDHGIETPEQRIQKGKNPEGEIRLSAFHRSGRLIIEIRDDGAGIDGARLKTKAMEKGILSNLNQMSDQDGINLIFHPGFSTKAEVSEVSGRGVGMDVVKTNIERLQGNIQIETKIGSGTIFKVSLPLTVAIIEGLVIRAGTEKYVVPLAQVHETVRIKASEIDNKTGIGEVFSLRGEAMNLFRLTKLLGRNIKQDKLDPESAILVFREGDQPYCILIDEILGQQQIVVKKLGNELSHIKGFSGSSILGDGRPALILETSDLLNQRRAA
jgi:two-component system chemotaxis sensor kinase CheA